MNFKILLSATIFLAFTTTTTFAETFSSASNITTKNVLLTFNPNPRSIIRSISQRNFISRGDKINQLVSSLERNSETSQQSVQDFLSSKNIPFTSIWISNQLSIKNADSSLILELSERFKDTVTISEDIRIPLPNDIIEPSTLQNSRRDDSVIEWGVQRVRSREAVLAMTSLGIIPAPIRVSIIDTGVRGTHEALVENYYGTYGWFDPYEMSTAPNDGNGHGTHVMGTMVGKKGIGVYPLAKWMACKGCENTGCALSGLLLCGMYITCPTLPDMSGRNCSEAPHIVGNSWGGGQGEDWYDVVIEAWHAAGIIPVFANGNYGPACGTASSPGDRNVIAVGSTTNAETISSFSGKGPAVDGGMKPDVSAPGSAIISSVNSNDSAYDSYSGTSMATPHVSGVISILLAAKPDLTYAEVKTLLEAGVDTEVLQSGNAVCGGISDSTFPNPIFGYGRVNAFKSLMLLLTTTTTTTTTTPSPDEEISTTTTTTEPPPETRPPSTPNPTNPPVPRTTPTSSAVFITPSPTMLIAFFALMQIFKFSY